VARYLAVRGIPRLPFGTRRTSFVLAVAQNPNLLLDRPVAPRALRRHDWKSTRLLQPPRERLLAQAGFQCQLPRTDRIFAGQARHHPLFKGQGEWLRHRIVACSPR
jgi:hypothetical protein